MAQATYKTAIEFVAKWEGWKHGNGYSNHPLDAGGPTAYGITQKTYDGWRRHKNRPLQGVEKMQVEEALEIYREMYWDVYTRMPGSNLDLDRERPDFAICVFDSGVNCGTNRAFRWANESLKQQDPTKHLLGLRERHYIQLAEKHPSQNAFLKGWINRLNDLKKLVQIIQQDALP